MKTGRDNGSFSNISLTECREALSERQFGKSISLNNNITKMAPVFMACRLSPCCLLSLLFAIALLICICCRDVSALLVYDCQTLYNVRASKDTLSGRYVLGNHQSTGLPPFMADIPAFLHQSPCIIPRKKCWRQRGKRGGVLVRFKAYLASTYVTCPHDGCYVPAARRSLEMRGRWLCPVFPSSTVTSKADLLTVPSPPM